MNTPVFGILRETNESAGALLATASRVAPSPKEAKMRTKSIPDLTPAQQDRFWAKVDVPDQPSCCWEWTGSSYRDYGLFGVNNVTFRSHRIAYQLLVGEIEMGLVLDHLCRNHRCVNPDHLEPVTQKINTERAFNSTMAYLAGRTHCAYGHEYTPETTYFYSNPNSQYGGRRRCKICNSINCAKYRERRRVRRQEAKNNG